MDRGFGMAFFFLQRQQMEGTLVTATQESH
jgi:hypothetical protein